MPKYLADRISLNGSEYRVIGDTDAPMVEVWGKDFAWEFLDRQAAYAFIGQAYKTANDLRNIPSGQEIMLTMSNGEQKKMNVLLNDANQITVVDTSGRQFNIPHMQPGTPPRILPKKSPENPAQSGDEGGPEPQDEGGGDATMMEPGTGVSYAYRNPLSKKTADVFPHRRPQHCSHDGAYLQRKDPNDPEKACPQCGMVYEAAIDPKLLRPWPKAEVKIHEPRNWKLKEKEHYRSQQFPPVEKGKKVDRMAATFNPFDEPAQFPEGKPKVENRPYRCMNCGHEQMIQTNHLGKVTDYCENCSWKPSFGNPDYAIPFNGRTYRPFEYAGPTKNTVYALSKKAQPMPGQGQPAPASEPPMSSEQQAPLQAPAGDQPQPQAGAGPGRPLSRHEIVTEAEILIRNALYKGIKIGTWDLVEYMKQQYSNPPEELYEGATKAWEKVQWEEQEAFEVAKGPGPQQQKQPGVEQEEAPNPMPVEEIAQRPQSGPIQVKV